MCRILPNGVFCRRCHTNITVQGYAVAGGRYKYICDRCLTDEEWAKVREMGRVNPTQEQEDRK